MEVFRVKELALSNILVLPDMKNPLLEQREEGLTHTTYLEETAFFSLVQQGHTELVRAALEKSAASGIVIGHLSDNTVRQMQYWAVCCVTLGIRYAIQGGLDEMTAFNLSDKHIMRIDSFTDTADIVDYLGKAVIELSELVRESAHGDCPVRIRKCLLYIDKNLHQTIRISDLAAHTSLSAGYLSKSFKKHLGKTIQEYIMEKKLDTAKALLRGGYDSSFISYQLGFCSQTYFITCFKKAFDMTPHKYADVCKGFA